MSEQASRRIFIAATALVIALALLALLLHSGQSGRAQARTSHDKRLILQTPSALAKAPEVRPKTPTGNIDPEVRNPALRAAHRRLLAIRPLEQHLPYRDHEIGADLVNVTATGKLVVLVTYLHSQAAAERDLRRLMNHYRDPGRAYVVRYQPVFR